jgi:cobalamin-dependent methionine synthase I
MPLTTAVHRDFEVCFDDPSRILVRIGYKKHPLPDDDPILALVREEAERAASLVRPTAVSVIIEATETDGHSTFLNAQKVALCVCTIGPRLEEECAAQFARNEDLRGLALDALGSEAVAQVTRNMDRLLAEEALRLGLWPSKKYAPGYRDWDVSHQAFLFSRVPAEQIGVRLTESFMMVPRKSYSFRINFYADKSLTSRRFPLPPG